MIVTARIVRISAFLLVAVAMSVAGMVGHEPMLAWVGGVACGGFLATL